MIRSMTGFGESERETVTGRIRVEVRTVNHRNLNVHLRTPQGLERFEPEIQGWLRDFFARGHVKYSLTIDRSSLSPESSLPELDLERARSYRDRLETLKEELGLEGDLEVGHFIRFGELFKTQGDSGDDPEVDAERLRELTVEASAAAVTMRDLEGERLQEDLVARLDGLSAGLDEVEAQAPERLTAERERLRKAIKEIAYLAEKWDINEEIVRFRSHLEQFRGNLSIDPPEPVGKRLGFILQEMQREANTIGSKANSVEIGSAVVRMKEEIERLREQLENIE
jgi:uncharacterized protein (TIGR00255 family)